MVRANFLDSFRRKLDERWFRQLDYVLILFLIVTVNEFLEREISHFSVVTTSCFRGYDARMAWFLRQINLLNFPRSCGTNVKVKWEY